MEQTDRQGKKEPQLSSIDPGSLLVLVYVGVLVVILLLSAFSVSHAAVEERRVAPITLNEVTRGELLIPSAEQGKFTRAPILSQKADIEISAMTARTTLTQRFNNPGDEWIEAQYVFPLPDSSGVDKLDMIVGERRIRGVIKETEQAKALYQQAADEGKKASLVLQKRPNIFVTSVANIGPGEEVTIEIQYQQKVMLKDGVFSLRLPMAITPRYQPLSEGVSSPLSSFTESGWSAASAETATNTLPFILNVSLNSGFDIGSLRSLYHGITDQEKNGTHTIGLNGLVKADRDFVLEWEPKNSKEIQASLFTEQIDKENFALIMLTPPTIRGKAALVPRELIYILDISGSMAGKSIREAKKSLLFSLEDLEPGNRFNIIVFNNSAEKLFEQAVAVDRNTLDRARRFIQGLEADGGTEMAPALEMAFAGRSPGYMRQIVFITDGAVSNELELFSLIERRLGESRLFTVGIGSAPNTYFMSRAASFGRGTSTTIGNAGEVGEKMSILLHKLSTPQCTNLQLLTGNGQRVDSYPSPIPDLYTGEPVVVAAKIPEDDTVLKVSGMIGQRPWSSSFFTGRGAQKSGIAKVWAREKIRYLMESVVTGNTEEKIRKGVVDTALKYHLVSKYTSLVAVEEKSSRPKEGALQRSDVKNMLPHGMKPSAIYGGGAQTATAGPLLSVVAAVFLTLSIILYLFNTYRELFSERKRQ